MRNHLLNGVGIGAIAPLIAFLAGRFSEMPALLAANPLRVYAIAALFNLLLVRYFYRDGQDRSGQGVVLITFLGLLVLIVTKQI